MSRPLLRCMCFIALCASSAVYAALDRGEQESSCNRFFKGGSWKLARDPEVEGWAKEFLAKASIKAIPVVCIGAPNTSMTAASHKFSSGFEEYFFLGFDAILRLSIGGELRAIIAHEVAHLVTDKGVHCKDRIGVDGYVACEHAADLQADIWAGRGSMPRSLNWTIEHIIREYGTDDPSTKSEITFLRRRIFLLR